MFASTHTSYVRASDLFQVEPQLYKPGPRSVLVIGPGGGTRMNAQAYQAKVRVLG